MDIENAVNMTQIVDIPLKDSDTVNGSFTNKR